MSRVFRAQTIAPRTSVVNAKPPPPREIVVEADPREILRKARTLASKVAEEAKATAASVLEKANDEAKTIRVAAQEEGFEEGVRRGYEEGLKRAETIVEEAKAALLSAQRSFEEMLSEAEPKLLALAMTAARRVASEALKTDPEVVLDLLRRGITALGDETEFTARVDPELLATLGGAQEKLAAELGSRSIEILADPSVSDGFVVKSPHGFVDARISSQMANVALSLAEARRRATGEPR